VKRLLLALFLSFVLYSSSLAQPTTNVGTDFWLAFPPNYDLTATLLLFISSDFPASGSVTSAYPGVNQLFTVTPGIVTQLLIPSHAALGSGIEDKGIRIIADNPISVYGLNRKTATTDAYMALPVSALGTDYRVLTYKTTMNNMGSSLSVIATQNGTSVTIFNHQDNSTTNISLNEGQTYRIEAIAPGEDLTGSRIQSNVPVAVFGSEDITYIPAGCTYADHIVEEMFPISSWGKKYVTVPLAGRDLSGDLFRILANEDGTGVDINEVHVATLNAGDYFETNLAGYNSIIANKAVLVAQFAKGTSCSGNTTGDPFMMLIPPREQFLDSYTICTLDGFTSNWVNIVVPGYAVGSIIQDGVPIPAGVFVPVAGTTYFGTQVSISSGSHTFTGSAPFGVFVYGWTTVDSYGYPGGGSMSPVGTVNKVTLSPASASGILNVTTLCFTAFVEDDLANPVEGVLVNFNIGGINPLTGTAVTDSLGYAQYCYTQTGSIACMDSVSAEVFGFSSDTSLASWTVFIPCTNPVNGGSISTDQSGCGDYTPLPLTGITPPSGESGTLEYLWQESTTGPLTGFIDIPGTNAPGYSPPLITQTIWFRRLSRVDCMPDWADAAVSNAVMITRVQPVIPEITISETLNPCCSGEAVTFHAVPVNGGTTPFYQWKVNGTGTGTNSPDYTYVPVNGDVITCEMNSSLPCITSNPAYSNSIFMGVKPGPVVTFTACFDKVTTTNARALKLHGGLPLGGTYSGAGVSGGYFNPAMAGVGTHVITYSYTNNDLCSASSTLQVITRLPAAFTCGQAYTDPRDTTSYPTVQIGTQCWLASNLDYGTEVAWNLSQRDNCISEKYSLHPSPLITYSFYQWDEIMLYDETPGAQGVCPPSWHIPSENEWSMLFAVYINSGFAGSPLKYSGYTGFNALLPGIWHMNKQWDYQDFATFFWSSTLAGPIKAWAHGMNDTDPSVSRYPSLRSNAFSVRCLKD
jgi:uncharacterized protein (TIGR02145 family)